MPNSRALKDKPHQLFLKDKTPIISLHDLHHAFYTMSDKTYAYHAQRHDFSKWISGVLKDNELANDLIAAKTRVEARAIVAARLRELKAKHIKIKHHKFWNELMAGKKGKSKVPELDPVAETQARITYIKQLIRHDDFRAAYTVVKDIPHVYSKIDKDDQRRYELLYEIVKLKDYVEAFVET